MKSYLSLFGRVTELEEACRMAELQQMLTKYDLRHVDISEANAEVCNFDFIKNYVSSTYKTPSFDV